VSEIIGAVFYRPANSFEGPTPAEKTTERRHCFVIKQRTPDARVSAQFMSAVQHQYLVLVGAIWRIFWLTLIPWSIKLSVGTVEHYGSEMSGSGDWVSRVLLAVVVRNHWTRWPSKTCSKVTTCTRVPNASEKYEPRNGTTLSRQSLVRHAVLVYYCCDSLIIAVSVYMILSPNFLAQNSL